MVYLWRDIISGVSSVVQVLNIACLPWECQCVSHYHLRPELHPFVKLCVTTLTAVMEMRVWHGNRYNSFEATTSLSCKMMRLYYLMSQKGMWMSQTPLSCHMIEFHPLPELRQMARNEVGSVKPDMDVVTEKTNVKWQHYLLLTSNN